jgi:glycine/D-amino acid oxidase-like deaminating enzyme/nitrite reductase/ring-hydroxylating ferredoxin subunit
MRTPPPPGLDTSPYWIEAARVPRFRRPTQDLTVDAVVVGGGITGITAAYLLKQAGATVALLERDRLCGVDTSRTTAHLTSVTDLRLHELQKRFGAGAARAVWDAGAAAIDQIAATVKREEIPCDFKWVPGYLHARPGDTTVGTRRDLGRETAAAAALGIRADYFEHVPVFGTPGICFPHQAVFHPLRYLAALLRILPGQGSHVFESCAVESVLERPLAVKAGGVRIRCRYLVLATHNPLMGNTPEAAALLFQTKLALYSSYALGARLPMGTPAAAWWDTGSPYHYLRIESRRDHDYAIYGGEDHKTGQVEDTAAVYARLESNFRRLFPKAEVDHRWSGQVIETNDGLPLIGETAPHQFVATGYSGNGMTFGTLAAMMAVDAMHKRRNPWDGLFSVHRKKILGGTWEYLAENADYPFYLVRNWLAKPDGDDVQALRPGQGRILKLFGRKVAAYRSPEGKLSLCSPVCPHLQCVVDWNAAEKTWDCPCHGSRFKATGEVLAGPAEEDLERIAVRSPPGLADRKG